MCVCGLAKKENVAIYSERRREEERKDKLTDETLPVNYTF